MFTFHNNHSPSRDCLHCDIAYTKEISGKRVYVHGVWAPNMPGTTTERVVMAYKVSLYIGNVIESD